MNNKNKFILTCSLLFLSIFLFLAINNSTRASRSSEQKMFDDYLSSLNSIYNSQLKSAEDKQALPTFELQMNLQQTEKETLQQKQIFFSLNWSDSDNLKKGLRALELLSLANIFSNQPANPGTKFHSLLITTSSGYKFQAFFDHNTLKENSSLSLAIVLLKA